MSYLFCFSVHSETKKNSYVVINLYQLRLPITTDALMTSQLD